jgi:hypothetical protein
MKQRKGVKYIIALAAALLLMTGCQTTVHWQKINLSSSVKEGKLSKLENLTTNLDPGIIETSDNIMSNYLSQRGDPMGYYSLNFTYSSTLSPGGYVWAFASGYTSFILNVLGMPFQAETYTAEVALTIYDSQGSLVGTYTRSEDFHITTALYYGHDATKKAETVYSELLSDILKKVDARSVSINAMLAAAGPVTVQNRGQALSRINYLPNYSTTKQ